MGRELRSFVGYGWGTNFRDFFRLKWRKRLLDVGLACAKHLRMVYGFFKGSRGALRAVKKIAFVFQKPRRKAFRKIAHNVKYATVATFDFMGSTGMGHLLATLSNGTRTIVVNVATLDEFSASAIEAMHGVPQGEILSFPNDAAARQALGDLASPDAFERASALLDRPIFPRE